MKDYRDWEIWHYRYHIRVKLVLWGLAAVFAATLISDWLWPRIGGSLAAYLAAEDRSAFMLWMGEILPTLLYLVFATIFMNFLFTPLTERILALSHAARQIAGGNFQVQVSTADRRDEVYQLTIDFNRMARELRRNELMRKDFISGVSHELKTPLTVIHGYGELLGDEKLSPRERAEYSALVARESKRLLNMCSNMLQVSRLDSQAIPEQQQDFGLDEQLRRVLLFLEPRWSAKNIQVNVEELPPLQYHGCPELLEQVWSNLLDNAIKFTPPGGAISVQAEADAQAVTVSIRDNGCGMEADQLDRVFEQFYQGDRSRSHEGFGLGLAIVRRIVEMHNGAVWATSQPGEGSTFSVLLPR